MNGRVYDPLTAMFFSPDPYVQAPGNWLNYNRYGYCYGNPFRYTDPSGEFIQILIGALIGGTINWIAHGCQFNTNGLVAFGIGAAGGALAASTFGASLAAAGVAGYGGLLAGAYAGGTSFLASTMITSMGNTAYFHDPLPTAGQLASGAAFSILTAGLINGFSDPNYDFIGTRLTPVEVKALPVPTVAIKTGDVNVASKLPAVNNAEITPTATNEPLPMEGKMLTTVKGPDGQVVFRAVDKVEANVIKNTGQFSLQEGGLESKYFAKSIEDAHWYGERIYPNGYSVIQATVRDAVNPAQYWYPSIDIGAYVFPKETLPYIIPH